MPKATGAPNAFQMHAEDARSRASAPMPCTALYTPNAMPAPLRRREVGDERLLGAFGETEVEAVHQEPREQRHAARS